MKANVREVTTKDIEGNVKTLFVYNGFFCVKGGSVGYHTPRRTLRNGVVLSDIPTDDVFTMANSRFNQPSEFKSVVDEHIDYIKRGFGSLSEYFALNY